MNARNLSLLAALVVGFSLTQCAQALSPEVYTYTSFSGPSGGYAIAEDKDNDGGVLVAYAGGGGPTNDDFEVKRFDPCAAGDPLLDTYIVGFTRPDSQQSTTYPDGMDVDSPTGNIHIGSWNYAGSDAFAYSIINSSGGSVAQYHISQGVNDLEVDADGNAWLGAHQYATHIDQSDGSVINEGARDAWNSNGISVDPVTGDVWTSGYWDVQSFDAPSFGVQTLLFNATAGSGPGQFAGAGAINGIVVRHGRVYIGDAGNQKVLVFRQDTGEWIQDLNSPLDGNVSDIDVDSEGNVYALATGGSELIGVHVWWGGVPEPTTMILLGLGSVALLKRRRS